MRENAFLLSVFISLLSFDDLLWGSLLWIFVEHDRIWIYVQYKQWLIKFQDKRRWFGGAVGLGQCLQGPCPILECQCESWLLCCLSRFLIMHLGRQQETGQVLASCHPSAIPRVSFSWLQPSSALAAATICGMKHQTEDLSALHKPGQLLSFKQNLFLKELESTCRAGIWHRGSDSAWDTHLPTCQSSSVQVLAPLPNRAPCRYKTGRWPVNAQASGPPSTCMEFLSSGFNLPKIIWEMNQNMKRSLSHSNK